MINARINKFIYIDIIKIFDGSKLLQAISCELWKGRNFQKFMQVEVAVQSPEKSKMAHGLSHI